MNIFNRDFAVVTASGRVLAETNDGNRAEQYASEYQADGIACSVVKSDCPHRSEWFQQ